MSARHGGGRGRPVAAAYVAVKVIEDAFLAARIVVRPLRSPQDEINLRCGLNADAARAAVIAEVSTAGSGPRARRRRGRAAHPLRIFDSRMNHRHRLSFFQQPRPSGGPLGNSGSVRCLRLRSGQRCTQQDNCPCRAMKREPSAVYPGRAPGAGLSGPWTRDRQSAF